MQSRNISRLAISQTLSETIYKRSYSIPHVIHDLPLTSADQSILTALFKLQDDFLTKSKGHWGWFFASTSLVAKVSRRSETTVKRSRIRFKYMGLIDYRLGNKQSGRATEYQILIDPFYLADRALSRGSKRVHTKTMATNKNNKQEATDNEVSR